MSKKHLLRAAHVRSQSFDADANTVEIVWTTGAAVERYGYDGGYVEVLSLEPGAVRLDRLNAGAPYLNTHQSWALENVIGSVVRGSARIEDGQGIATVKLSGAAADADTVGKIRDGIIRNNSVGYLVHAYRDSEKDGVTTRLVTDWEPLEISAVPIPADAGAQIRSHGRRKGNAKAARRSARMAPKVSARVADIRRWSARAGLTKFGEEHIRAGTSSDNFFWLLAERLGVKPKDGGTMKKTTQEERDFERGRRHFLETARLLDPAKRRAEDEKLPLPKEDEDDEDRDDDICPKCGQTLDDHDQDDEERDNDDADDDRERSLRSGRRVHQAPIGDFRSSYDRGADEARKLVKPSEARQMAEGAAHWRKVHGKK